MLTPEQYEQIKAMQPVWESTGRGAIRAVAECVEHLINEVLGLQIRCFKAGGRVCRNNTTAGVNRLKNTIRQYERKQTTPPRPPAETLAGGRRGGGRTRR